MRNVKKAVILCGGLATRFLPISLAVCKEMMPLGDVPVIDIVVRELKEAGVEQILIIVGRGKEILQSYFDRNIEIEQRLKFAEKTELLKKIDRKYLYSGIYFMRQIEAQGTGYATRLAKDFVGDDPFLLVFPDEIVIGKKSAAKQLVQGFDEIDRVEANLIAVKRVSKNKVSSYGIVSPKTKTDEGVFEINGIIEKPSVKEAPSLYSFMGYAVLSRNIFDAINKSPQNKEGELGITDAFNLLAATGAVFAKKVKGRRFDIGSAFGLLQANNYLIK